MELDWPFQSSLSFLHSSGCSSECVSPIRSGCHVMCRMHNVLFICKQSLPTMYLLGRLGLRLEVGKALQFALTLSKHFDVYP